MYFFLITRFVLRALDLCVWAVGGGGQIRFIINLNEKKFLKTKQASIYWGII